MVLHRFVPSGGPRVLSFLPSLHSPLPFTPSPGPYVRAPSANFVSSSGLVPLPIAPFPSFSYCALLRVVGLFTFSSRSTVLAARVLYFRILALHDPSHAYRHGLPGVAPRLWRARLPSATRLLLVFACHASPPIHTLLPFAAQPHAHLATSPGGRYFLPASPSFQPPWSTPSVSFFRPRPSFPPLSGRAGLFVTMLATFWHVPLPSSAAQAPRVSSFYPPLSRLLHPTRFGLPGHCPLRPLSPLRLGPPLIAARAPDPPPVFALSPLPPVAFGGFVHLSLLLSQPLSPPMPISASSVWASLYAGHGLPRSSFPFPSVVPRPSALFPRMLFTPTLPPLHIRLDTLVPFWAPCLLHSFLSLNVCSYSLRPIRYLVWLSNYCPFLTPRFSPPPHAACFFSRPRQHFCALLLYVSGSSSNVDHIALVRYRRSSRDLLVSTLFLTGSCYLHPLSLTSPPSLERLRFPLLSQLSTARPLRPLAFRVSLLALPCPL